MKGHSIYRIFPLALLPTDAWGFIPPPATTATIAAHRSSPSLSPSQSPSLPSIGPRTNGGTGLYAFWDRLSVSPSGPTGAESGIEKRERTPFVIDRIVGATDLDREQISSLVIKVFFEEEAERKQQRPSGEEDGGDRGSSTGGSMTPWKAFQLMYLKNLQNGDMKGKRFIIGNLKSDMFVARRVVPSTSEPNDTDRVEISDVYNPESLRGKNAASYYARDAVIGFVDITEKNFGLASEYDLLAPPSSDPDDAPPSDPDPDDDGDTPPVRIKSTALRPLRPVLTNLAVDEGCRFGGVGSRLVDACEDAVVNLWGEEYGRCEIILEVEEENLSAQRFYERRGYRALFADPSTRRYDASGFFLKNVRTTKICYQKDLRMKRAQQKGNRKNGELNDFFGSGMFQILRDAMDSVGK